MGKMTLFGSMAMGLKIALIDSRSGFTAVGTIMQITMENGPKPGHQPNTWMVKVITSIGSVEVYVKTVD